MSFLHSLRALWTAGKGISLGLPEITEGLQPIDLFDAWFSDAQKSGLYLPEAMTVATATAEGKPSARMVLLKSVDVEGFVFFTNYESRKASEIEANSNVSILFHWPILQRQVRIEGRAERVSREESNDYFQSRPRGSRIGAWASTQSSKLESKAALQARVKEVEAQFGNGDIPLPDYWGGYRIRPDRMEFWQGRPFRLHDRLIYERVDGDWKTHRLFP